MKKPNAQTSRSLLLGVCSAALLHAASLAWAATTDISTIPVFAAGSANVHPNILFVIDDSGSMAWDYLPDAANFSDSSYGLRAAQCNGLAFNPDIAYTAPVNHDGVRFANASYAAAYTNIFFDKVNGNSLPSSTNLATTNAYYYKYTGAEKALSYRYPPNEKLDTNTNFYKECSSIVGSSPGASKFQTVYLNDQPSQQANYANWYSFYSNRIAMMKTATSQAFAYLDTRYRVGFNSINNKTADPSHVDRRSNNFFLDVKEFDNAQRQRFYEDLFSTNPSYGTPLRGALALSGQYYANKAPGQSSDPVQYACQKNYLILSTDGYWNTSGESSSPKYGPYKLDNSTSVGQQDGPGTERPMLDTAITNARASDTLADIAMYYYQTDLRTSALNNCTGALGQDVCNNNVGGSTAASPANRDTANWQHLTTFTLGLGNVGTLTYDPNYLTQTSGDYFQLAQGTKEWPVPDGGAANIDDLWHAAVNGRGQFFSAANPTSLVSGLKTALDAIAAENGTAAAATPSNLQTVPGDSNVYVAQFTSGHWTGDVKSFAMDPATGVISSSLTWSAQNKLAVLPAASRTIYHASSGVLTPFLYNRMHADTQAFFTNFCSAETKPGVNASAHPGQCAGASDSALDAANSGSNLVDYLRGDPAHANGSVFRSRSAVLGDIVNSSPIFVGKPNFPYTDAGYASFTATSRTAVVYVAANDGMLHAFDSSTGTENWAFVPSAVLPQLYKLADTNYPANHMALVDATPVVGDVYDPTLAKWRTILVGGLGLGGRSYYALDITLPDSPTLLWEFSDADLGYTFGNPLITKLANGTWVVAFASGYNNVSPGDGNGHLYVLNALSGARVLKIDTLLSNAAVGTSLAPSGLAKINAYVESDKNNTAKAIYGGDLMGNVWRFDISSLVRPFVSAMQLAKLQVGTKAQAITTKPALAQVRYHGVAYKVVVVGTGKYLGTSDVADTTQHSIYALKDAWTETGLGNVRTATQPALVAQTARDSAGGIRTGSRNRVDWGTGIGWSLDLISLGERVSTNPSIVLDTLYVAGNVPKSDACSSGGNAWLYKLDLSNGAPLATDVDDKLATQLEDSLVVGTNLVQLTGKEVAIMVTESGGNIKTVAGGSPKAGGSVRRTSWRILK